MVYVATERSVRNKILKRLKDLNIMVLSHSDKFMSGVPDLYLVDLKIFIELKSPIGKTSLIQDYMFNEIRKHGGIVHVIQSVKELDEIITRGGGL